MIWFILGVTVLVVLIFLLAPLYKKTAPSIPASAEVENYTAQINDIEAQLLNETANTGALTAKKIELQRHLLASSGQQMRPDAGPPVVILSGLIIGFGFAAMGLYAILGNPDLTEKHVLQKSRLTPETALSMNAEPQHENNASLPDLVARLEVKLANDPNNPEGWRLYARSLMTMDRFADAFMAYEQVMVLTGNNPNVAEEIERARAFAEQKTGGSGPQTVQQPGPSAEDISAAAAMSESDRAAMIQNMVEGLASKLEDDPENPEGWARLLQARKVLGQDAQAKKDIARLKTVYADRPDLAKEILFTTGWPLQ